MSSDPQRRESNPTCSGVAPRSPTSVSAQLQALLQSRGCPDLARASRAWADTASAPDDETLFALMHDQRQRWYAGDRRNVERYLDEHPSLAANTDAVLHLIYNEVLLREELGEPPELAEFLERFPHLAADLNIQFELHQAIPPDSLPATTPAAHASGTAPMPRPGDCLHDFQIIRLLGSGSFASVYLARQLSLDRLVALKVSSRGGSEARTLASMEHNHIVQVFSETVDPEHDRRLLCMQYVPGTTLADVIEYLAKRPGWTGRDILDAIDLAVPSTPVTLDPAALRDREYLSRCDAVEAVCWIGGRLAEALSYAHSLGVLHRDIKPANILMNAYGRPLLADFNLALDTQRTTGAAGETFGGTLEYMSPEHLDAFNPLTGTRPDVVDERSDLYSLGVVLFELLTSRRPFPPPPSGPVIGAVLEMTAERREVAPSPGRVHPGIPAVLDRVMRRCLEPEPERRYQRAGDLALALEGAEELGRIEQEMPPLGRLGRLTYRWPFLMLFVWVFLPHVLGSVENILYNGLRIPLSADQKWYFVNVLLPGYNLPVYSVALVILYRLGAPVYRVWGALERGDPLPAEAVTVERRRALTWPSWVVAVSCVGWLPGGLLFPFVLDRVAPDVSLEVYLRFAVSFALSGLIALVYSYFAAEYVVLRIFYPRLWLDEANVHERAAEELAARGKRLGFFQLLAGLIPLTGAVLMILVGPEQFVEEHMTATDYRGFRLLVTVLIALGMTGFGIALLASSQLNQTLAALVGRPQRRRSPSAAAAARKSERGARPDC